MQILLNYPRDQNRLSTEGVCPKKLHFSVRNNVNQAESTNFQMDCWVTVTGECNRFMVRNHSCEHDVHILKIIFSSTGQGTAITL